MRDLETLGTVYTPFSSYDAKKENLALLNQKHQTKILSKRMIDSKKSRKIPELLFARCELVGGNIELENEFLKTDFIGCQSEFCCSSVTPTGSGARQFQLRSVAQSCGVQDVLPTEKF